MAPGLLIRGRKLDFPIDPAGANERRVERLNLVGRHDDLDVHMRIEAIKLVEEFEHCPLDLALSARRRVVPFGAHCINFVDEDNRRRLLLGHTEELAHELGPVAEVFLNELRAGDSQKSGGSLVRDRLGQERLARTRLAIQDDALGRADANVLIQLRMSERQLHSLLDLLDLGLEPSDVRVRFERRLVHLHHRHHRVGLISEKADN
mmetsp:Transcript_25046/g.79035  ORF Transcript_25046/g.79035 Transcript_25046/m.79035 type:complete len:206 (+) Transcript_25046:707-1324(+)